MDIANEGLACIRFAVVIGVFENQQLVLHWFGWIPVWIAGPNGDPKTTFGIKSNLNWIDQLRELRLFGKQFDLHVLVHSHLFDGFIAADELMLSTFEWTWLVGNHRNERRNV